MIQRDTSEPPTDTAVHCERCGWQGLDTDCWTANAGCVCPECGDMWSVTQMPPLPDRLKSVEEMLVRAQRVRPWRVAWHVFVWFNVPFVSLWAFGVEPLTAARFAIAPSIIIGTLILGSSSLMLWGAKVLLDKAKQADEG